MDCGFISTLRESRRKTPVAVSLRDNERLFSDSALTTVCLKVLVIVTFFVSENHYIQTHL